MSEIELKYTLLNQNKSSVEGKINELLNIVEEIDKKCKSLNNDETWSGLVASKFQETTGRLYTSAANRVLNFKNTNEYKSVVTNTFMEAENASINSYM